MRSFAPAQFHIRHFGLWRVALVALWLTAWAALLAWRLAQSAPADNVPWLLWSAVVLSLGVSMWEWMRPASLSLRWDSRQWHLGPADGVGSEPLTGSVGVALDLGGWMLLRFQPETGPAWLRPLWLPVQRLGMQAQWHALRCAVYSPRSPSGFDAAADA